ncbi:hypothetical protein VCHA53P481_100178 [Vibrio chagasii]|nr:hypothetical protein VCHA35O137_110164 [Vibrio chagasii]CAH6897917.1 hypothetical protein VCHA38P215_100173 [Vibrio chagasii]CAH6913013.1 hypothetical protein VCHA43P284_100002 [Vibrio chagasii]CAH6940509.1 hypothetical protein VCHA53P481_100178 [Vibrio chagasii]CAH6950709.1 hypothetical protein VCHA48P442_100168 [Vibrio chagasii]
MPLVLSTLKTGEMSHFCLEFINATLRISFDIESINLRKNSDNLTGLGQE